MAKKWWTQLSKREKFNLVSKGVIWKLTIAMWFYNKLLATIMTIFLAIDIYYLIIDYKIIKGEEKNGRKR